MIKFSLFFLLLPLLKTSTANDFHVEIKLVEPFSRERLQLQVVVRNLSSTTVRVLKTRTQDFKRNSTTTSGNYIIEIEKWMGNGGYYLWEPPTVVSISSHAVEKEYILFQKEKSITDIIHIGGQSAPNDLPWIFSPGLYRIRISFNQSEWGFEQINHSNWVEFSQP